MPDYGLGRLPAPDARDLRHTMLAALPAVEVPLPAYKYWYPGAVLDQGATSSCVGHAWQGWLNCSPLRTNIPGLTPFDIYRQAQLVDEWPGEEPVYEGTSVRAGAKVMEARNKLGEYVWATDMETLKRWVCLRGPVVFGTVWTNDMFTPDALGFVHPTNAIAGGHAYLCTGYSRTRRAFRCMNSWGVGWGQRGRFWIHEEDVNSLMGDGEFCGAVEV